MDLRVEVSNEDIRMARDLWQGACSAGAPTGVVELLLSDYVQLISAQAQQIADDFRLARAIERDEA